MKKTLIILMLIVAMLLPGCSPQEQTAQVVATTKPVYDFTFCLCQNTDITVDLLVTESLSCLHDYTLQVRQMRAIEGAQVVVLSGAGLEAFLQDAIPSAKAVIDSSEGISLICAEHEDDDEHEHDGHHHDQDPHIWLSVSNARIMAHNIFQGLCQQFPEYCSTFQENLEKLNAKFDTLDAYGQEALSNLSHRDLITFHDGFGYFAEYWNLNLVRSLEEESGSEASAAELKELIQLVTKYNIPAIFTEENGSTSAAQVVAREAGISVYTLNMGMSETDYFESMYHNIDTIKEALG